MNPTIKQIDKPNNTAVFDCVGDFRIVNIEIIPDIVVERAYNQTRSLVFCGDLIGIKKGTEMCCPIIVEYRKNLTQKPFEMLFIQEVKTETHCTRTCVNPECRGQFADQGFNG